MEVTIQDGVSNGDTTSKVPSVVDRSMEMGRKNDGRWTKDVRVITRSLEWKTER